MKVRHETDSGTYEGGVLRFSGELVASYQPRSEMSVELYKCANGYRVYVNDSEENKQTLHPCEPDPYT